MTAPAEPHAPPSTPRPEAARAPVGLAACLRPMDLAGEVLRFDLAGYRSTVTRELLQVRVRLTGRAFGVGHTLVGANVADGGRALHVDPGGLLDADARAAGLIEDGPGGAIAYVRRLAAVQERVARTAAPVEAALAAGERPDRASLGAYVWAVAHHQALGALRFCLPPTLGPRVAACLADPGLVDALLAPEEPSLWSTVRRRELALAHRRLLGPGDEYRRHLARHRRAFGYLGGEDVEFRASESTEALDARIAGLAAGGRTGLTDLRRRLAESLAADRARKAQARRCFADRLAAAPVPGAAALVAQVVLARATTAHEDANRRAKMRLLRDLRDVAGGVGLDLEHDGLAAFLAACAPTGVPRIREPVAVLS